MGAVCGMEAYEEGAVCRHDHDFMMVRLYARDEFDVRLFQSKVDK